MPGLNSSLSIGLSGLQASQAALNVVGHNIANVNTPNYSRQRALLANNDSQSFGTMQFGQGVNLNNILGVRDRFLEMQITQATSRKSGSNARYSTLEGISPAFMETGDASDLNALVQNFFSGFQDVAARPEDSAARTALIGRAQSMVNGIESRWQLLQDQRKQADSIIGTLITEINTITTEIAKLNARIGGEPTPGSDSDARDQRQGLANKLADLVGVQVFEDSKGQMQITLDSGAAVLVSGITAYSLKGTPDPALPNFYRVDVDLGSISVNITASVKEGALGANLDLRDTILPGFQQKLDELASRIGTRVNALHNPGFGLDGVNLRDFFTGLPATVAGSAHAIQVNAVLVADPRRIAAANAAGAVGNNVTARDISKLYDSENFGAAVGSLTTSIGTEAQKYKSRNTSDENLVLALQTQHERVSGVDLDEEATQMMAFQRGYQASARFISVINQLTDQLVNQFGR